MLFGAAIFSRRDKLLFGAEIFSGRDKLLFGAGIFSGKNKQLFANLSYTYKSLKKCLFICILRLCMCFKNCFFLHCTYINLKNRFSYMYSSVKLVLQKLYLLVKYI